MLLHCAYWSTDNKIILSTPFRLEIIVHVLHACTIINTINSPPHWSHATYNYSVTIMHFKKLNYDYNYISPMLIKCSFMYKAFAQPRDTMAAQ